MISRAIFGLDQSEYEAVKERVQKKQKRKATVKEIQMECKCMIADPGTLRSNGVVVLVFCEQRCRDSATTCGITCP
jgi:hypothetical protein